MLYLSLLSISTGDLGRHSQEQNVSQPQPSHKDLSFLVAHVNDMHRL